MTQLIQNDPKYKVFKVVDTQYAQDDDSKSYDVTVNLMQAHPNLRVIISSSAVSAPAGARAIVASGKADKVFSTGFALPNAIKSYIQDGSESLLCGIRMSLVTLRSTRRISSSPESST
jgi:rhamnose transport system substrate-binding protein